jgi:DNA-binding CsgD family transcriptional regulator
MRTLLRARRVGGNLPQSRDVGQRFEELGVRRRDAVRIVIDQPASGESIVSDAPFGLSDKECAVLRLLARGHDAKSAATALGVSVHTVNERLREARAKTGAASSRAAARLLADRDGPENLVSEKLRVPAGATMPEPRAVPHPAAPAGPRPPGRWELLAMLIVFAAAMIAIGAQLGAANGAAPAAPHVVSTYPAQGATIDAGALRLRVTFDRPMRAQSYSFVRKDAATYPECGANKPEQSPDGRSFTLTCRVQAGSRYEIWFNDASYRNFVDPGGTPAVPFGLRFAVSGR